MVSAIRGAALDISLGSNFIDFSCFQQKMKYWYYKLTQSKNIDNVCACIKTSKHQVV